MLTQDGRFGTSLMKNYLTFFLLLGSFSAFVLPAYSATSVLKCPYTLKRNDTLSGALYEKGLGRGGKGYYLYGEQGWLKKNFRANPQIDSWNSLEPGTPITLLLPAEFVSNCEGVAAQETGSGELEASASDIQSEPPSNLGAETDAILVSEDKWKSLDLQIRYYRVVSPSSGILLIPRLSQFIGEIDFFHFVSQEFRLRLGYLPQVRETFLDQDYTLSSGKAFFGPIYHFSFLGPVDLSLSPSLGFWQYKAALPLEALTGFVAKDFAFLSPLSLALEVEAKWMSAYTFLGLRHRRQTSTPFLGRQDEARGELINYEAAFGVHSSPSSQRKAVWTLSMFIMTESVRVDRKPDAFFPRLVDSLTAFYYKGASERSQSYNSLNVGLGIKKHF